jgi:hypothetical protein
MTMTARELDAEYADELERCEVCGAYVAEIYLGGELVMCESCYVDPCDELDH